MADAVDQLVQILTSDLPEDKETIMTFAQQLEQRGLKKGIEQGRFEMAKSLLAEGLSLDLVKKVTKLPDLDLTELAKA